MTGPTLDLDTALWRFVLPFYGSAGVSPACLVLQDRIGVDVNILLVAAYATAERGIGLDQEDLAAADALVMKELPDWGSGAGLVAIDRQGRIAMPFNTEGMYRGARDSSGRSEIAIY